jgi:large subunit ribosomal protein L17
MRHRKAGLKLNRTPSHRNAMFRNMVTSLLKHERIRTTGAKAKEIRRWADHMITLAKRGDLHARRQALAIVREKEVVHKLFEQADERFGAVSGGYTRVIKLGRRPGDAAPMSLVELIALQATKKKKTKKKKTKTEGKQKKKAVDKKAPAVAEGVKKDEKEKTPVTPKVKATDTKEVAEVEAKKASVKEASVKTKDEPLKVKTESAKVKAKSAVGETKEDTPAKKTKSAPEKQAATAVKKDPPDTTTKKDAVKKPVKDEE